LKAQKRATLVGETTAGAFLAAGMQKFDGDKFILYLAMKAFNPPDVTTPIEGVGVSPDVNIPDPGPYTSGADDQLQGAIDILAPQQELPTCFAFNCSSSNGCADLAKER
jgi:carboxyl-terminal processing protease